jgi:hypothetical protein
MEDKVVIELDMKAIIVRQFERSELLPSIVGCPSAVSDKGALQPRILGSKSFLQLPKYNSLRSNSPSIEVNRIRIDNDKDGAMRFIKDYVEPALHRLNYGHCHQIYSPKEGDEK